VMPSLSFKHIMAPVISVHSHNFSRNFSVLVLVFVVVVLVVMVLVEVVSRSSGLYGGRSDQD